MGPDDSSLIRATWDPPGRRDLVVGGSMVLMTGVAFECDVLGVGCTAVDELLYVPSFPQPDGKVRVRRRERSYGGLTGTALVAAARLGARAAFAGRLGRDDLSREVEDDLRQHGVDVTEVVHRDDARPGRATIIVDEGSGTRAVLSEALGVRGADDELPAASVIRGARVLLVDGHGPRGSIRAARIARNAGRAVVADFERADHDDFDTLLGLVDHLILSARFAMDLGRASDPGEAAKTLWRDTRSVVVVTCGAAGGVWYAGTGAPERYEAVQVEAKDTTGCGDVFHGAYAAALAFGWPLARRIRFASMAAALKARSGGGRAGIPARSQVDAFGARRRARVVSERRRASAVRASRARDTKRP